MDEAKHFFAQVCDTIRNYQMVCRGERILCAVSGGADSVALLRVLCELREELGIEICACHVNHKLRGEESERDEAFACKLFAKLQIENRVIRCDVAAEAVRAGQGIEETARQVRYAALQETARAFGAVRIATAHTVDDTLETMIFHLARGTGSRGLGGIPPVRGNIIRPLIDCTREQVEAYLECIEQPFVTDSTNLSTKYTRNRIRHDIIPVLREINPRCAQAAGRAAQFLRQDEAFLSEIVQEKCEKLVRHTQQGVELDCTAFLAEPERLHGRILHRILCAVGVAELHCSEKHVQRLYRLLQKQGNPSAQVQLPDGVWAIRQYETVSIGKPLAENFVKTTKVYAGFSGVVLGSDTKLTLSICPEGVDINKTFNNFYVNYDTIHFETLVARGRSIGDRICLHQNAGHSTLKKLMIAHRIPKHVRNRLIVLADCNGVVAVQGLGADVSRWAASHTNVLKICFEGEEK